MSDLLTTAEAARRLNISERTLRDIKRSGAIRYVVIGAKKVFFRPEDCDEYVTANVRRAEPATTGEGRVSRRSVKRGTNIVPFSQRR